MVKHDDSMLKCSFCGKSQDQVKKLIAGPEVYICDECVELCNQILDEEFFENKDKDSITGEKSKKGEKAIPKPHEIKAYLDEYIVGQEILDYEDLGMEAVRLVEVKNLPCFVITNKNGEDFYADL